MKLETLVKKVRVKVSVGKREVISSTIEGGGQGFLIRDELPPYRLAAPRRHRCKSMLPYKGDHWLRRLMLMSIASFRRHDRPDHGKDHAREAKNAGSDLNL